MRGIVFRVCCARSFLGRQAASKKIQRGIFLRNDELEGKGRSLAGGDC